MKKIYTTILVILLVGGAALIWILGSGKKTTEQPISQNDYLCDEDKTINAKYYKGSEAPKPQPEEMPTPTGSVEINLSDGRQLTLPQTISASGIRYASTSEDVIFWSKGNTAFIVENDIQTFSGCIAIAPDPGGLPQIYASSTTGFSIRYPEGYIVNSSYQYQALGPGKEINGVKFTIRETMATGTNLSSYDTGISVEKVPDVADCQAKLFIDDPNASSSEITDNNTLYSIAYTNGAGAGNFYEENVWAIPGANPCVAIRYFIHSMNIGNYTPGAVREFDKQALINQFDAIRRSLVLGQ